MDLLEIFKAILFGIVEGITEWLPISSTGHMILVEEFIKLDVSKEFWEMFLVVIQLGAIMAVVVLYWNKIFPFSFKEKPFIKMDIMTMWFKVAVATIPVVIIGLPLDDLFEELFHKPIPIAMMLIIYGILFIVVENQNKNKQPKVNDISELTYKIALIIGLFQVLALMPGTSRSGATIIGAMIIGTSRSVAAEFTFFLAIPAMFGASLYKSVKFAKLVSLGLVFTANEVAILIVGTVVAFLVSIFAIKFLMTYIKKNDFKAFGYYRIMLGIVVLIYFMFVK